MLAFAGAVEVDQRLCLLVIRAATVVVSGIQSPHGYEGVTRFSAVLLAENRDAIGLFENLSDAKCEQSGQRAAGRRRARPQGAPGAARDGRRDTEVRA
jgi:hypothetical protein